MVLPLVGKTPTKIVEIARYLRDMDYKIHVVLNDVPAEVAAQRAVIRFKKTGRFVDPEYVLTIGAGPEASYNRLKQEGLVDSYEHYSNDVAEGQRPRLLESGPP
jgi:hypothetical protein